MATLGNDAVFWLIFLDIETGSRFKLVADHIASLYKNLPASFPSQGLTIWKKRGQLILVNRSGTVHNLTFARSFLMTMYIVRVSKVLAAAAAVAMAVLLLFAHY
jgi:hypothetical protein